MTAREKAIHQQGLVSLLRQLHDELDAAVFAAYGWEDLAEKLVGRPGATTPWPEKPDDQLLAEEKLLQRLVTLNHQRAAEEKRGIIRWLRPEYQNPQGADTKATTPEQAELDTSAAPVETTTAKTPWPKTAWPKTLAEQVKALRAALDRHPEPATCQQLARTFKGAQLKRVSEILDTLVAMGQAREEGGRVAAA